MAEALGKIHGNEAVNHALASCAKAGRFADGDLARILAHQQQAGCELVVFPGRSEESSLQAFDSCLGRVRRMTVTTPPAPPIPEELERLCRRLRLPICVSTPRR